MSKPENLARPIRVTDLSSKRPNAIELVLTKPQMAALAADLGLEKLAKTALRGDIVAQGRGDWRLDATLGATVTQPCVATLAPVTTRLDVPVTRTLVSDYTEPEDAEVEMAEDETIEPLSDTIDIGAVLQEALTLALPLYPRADGADTVSVQLTEPGKRPLTDEDAHPFAALAALKGEAPDSDT